MKTPSSNKKAQGTGYAVPVILLGFLGLFLIYIILVYPSERAKLLTLDDWKTDELKSPLGEDTSIIYSSAETFEVGRSIGQEVFSWKLSDVSVSHAAVPKTVDSISNRMMYATLVTSDTHNFNANNLNLDNTKEVAIKMNIAEVKGNPKIQILLNKTLVYEKTAVPGEMTIKLQPGLLNEAENPIHVRVKHQGAAIWSRQSINFDSINIEQYYYDPTNSVSSQTLIIPQNKYQGSRVIFEFNITNAVTDGELKINIQKPGSQKTTVWSGLTEPGIISASVDISKIGVGDNIIQFEADKGGAYTIAAPKIKFIAEAQPPATKVYSFDIDRDDLYSGGMFVLGIKVNRIIEPGSLFFKVGTSDVSYYFPSEELASGTWSYVPISTYKLKDLGNKITLDSVNGRFNIDGFMIILK